MSYLPQTKYGKCSQCGNNNTNVVKVKKDLFCIPCHQSNKTKVQIQKANNRNKVRSLNQYQKAEGYVDSISELKMDLDRVVSRYIRLRDMEADHKITCYCCGKRVPWQKAHCMHYIDRIHMATRYLLANLRSGCYECNVEKDGNLPIYGEMLERETYGIVEWLTEQSRIVTNVSLVDLKELLYDFQQKLKIVETKLTANVPRGTIM